MAQIFFSRNYEIDFLPGMGSIIPTQEYHPGKYEQAADPLDSCEQFTQQEERPDGGQGGLQRGDQVGDGGREVPQTKGIKTITTQGGGEGEQQKETPSTG